MKSFRVLFLILLAHIFGAVGGAAVGGASAGCSGAGVLMREVDQMNDPADDAAMRKCRQEMRAARDAGATPEASYNTYYLCTVDGGLR